MGWLVDFKAIKARVSMVEVLARYGTDLHRINANRLRGPCPLPSHKPEKGGASFCVDTAKNVWACQSSSCVQAREGRKGGNVLDFVVVMERCAVREAAVKLTEWFKLDSPGAAEREATTRARPKPEEAPVPERKKGGATAEAAKEESENRPLTFTLRGVDPAHPYLRERGIELATAEEFGIGFFPGRGLMQGRIVIPIRNERGELVAYAGRAIDGSEPKYKLPAGFKKSVLFNLDRALRDKPTSLIVVEGFFDCIRVWKAGFPNVVALMGSSMTDAQEQLLLAHARRAVLLLDGDAAGRAGATEIASRLVRRCLTRIVELSEGKQPDQLKTEELAGLLKGQT